MFRHCVTGLMTMCLALASSTGSAQVVRVAEMNTGEIRALDRSKSVVIIPGGILEEHGPYLPAYTDGILSEHLTKALAEAIAAKKPGWTVLVFPQIPLGASGSNELGGHFVFPGTYAVRPATLRAVFMDLAAELGEQGFRWIFVVNVHGAPLHNRTRSRIGLLWRVVQWSYGAPLGPCSGAWRLGAGPWESHRCREKGGRCFASRRYG